MKKLVYIILFLPLLILAQTTTENYIKNTAFKVATKNGTTKVSGGNILKEEKQVNINYFDGLGRAKQAVNAGAGGNKEDIITHFEYDQFGRQTKEYLPFTNGSYNVSVR